MGDGLVWVDLSPAGSRLQCRGHGMAEGRGAREYLSRSVDEPGSSSDQCAGLSKTAREMEAPPVKAETLIIDHLIKTPSNAPG